MICRAATDDDLGYVYETFLRSIRSTSTWVEGLENSSVIRLLENLVAKGWIITLAEQDGLVIGWAVHAPGNKLAYVYVRMMFRDQGVARYILKHAGVDTGKPLISPFAPNRLKLRLSIHLRPFEAL